MLSETGLPISLSLQRGGWELLLRFKGGRVRDPAFVLTQKKERQPGSTIGPERRHEIKYEIVAHVGGQARLRRTTSVGLVCNRKKPQLTLHSR